ncbi:LuxR C-terminal-related transcriptional regulator [Kitasatospora sp. NPDC002040]|uniref:LuxR C-terminal-related transcriptional regulator n=1 Tax=Kitasatospora sp. NPDC002040 TaxID=3154661 RepID=UPI00331961EF
MKTTDDTGWPAVLRRGLAPAGAGPVLLLVEGAAGTGKSHLLAGLGALPEAADATLVRGRCGAARPQWPELPREGPVLLLVDDVHRADRREREWLRGLLTDPWPGLAAVLAYRPEELALAGLPLGAPAVGYPPELTVLRHRTTGWDEERVRLAVARSAPGEQWTDEALARLYEVTGGVPQVVVDLLAAVRVSPGGQRTAEDVDAAGVPVRLAELVLGRTAALRPADRPIVWAAAVLAEPAGRHELVAVSGLGAERGREALLAALAGAALTDLAEGRYGLPVPLAASAAGAAVPGPLREEMHARAGAALARREPVPWDAVAGHRRAAGQVRGWLEAVERAARDAAEAGRHQHAIGLLEETLASSRVPPRVRARLAPLLAGSAVVALRSDQTVEVLTQLVRDPSLPVTVRGELRLDLALMLCNQLGRFSVGCQELALAATELHDTRPDLAGRAMAALAFPYWPAPSIDTNRDWLRKAVAAADASGSDATRAAVLTNRTTFAMCCGDHDAWDLVRSLPTDSPDRAVRQHAARGLCNAADAAVWLGLYQRAEELLAEGLDLSAESGAPYTEHTAFGTRLLVQWWTGRWAGLAERCERFVAATADMPLIASDARMVLGLLAFGQGDWGAAVGWLSGQESIGPENLPAPLAATVSGALVRLALARQDLPAAAEQARAAWSDVARKGVWAWAAELAPWAVEAVARAGDLPGARAMVRDFGRGVEGREIPVAAAALLWSRAALAEAEHEPVEAARLYREAATAYAALPRPYARVLTLEGAARCLLGARPEPPEGAPAQDAPADGGTERLVAELEDCTEQFNDLGAVWDAARTRALLRTVQPAKKGRPPGRPSHADELSPRESEVAELAGAGLTNREIAATLHLSPRTVEQHIARAMRKTGTLSRHDLVRRRR